ncbi:MAG: hypothetical protein R3A78_16355 [Polyangiales bacterium]|nr:hypothetical protein [Myxococcales bacterium]
MAGNAGFGLAGSLDATGGTEIIGVGPDHVVGVYRNMVLLHWVRNPESTDGIESLKRAFTRATRWTDRPIAFVTLIDADVTPRTPSQAFRDELATVLGTWSPKIGVSAIVFERTGLMACVIRSLITSIDLIIKPSYANSVFADTESAIAWLQKQVHPSKLTADDMREAVGAVRAAAGEATLESGVVRVSRSA